MMSQDKRRRGADATEGPTIQEGGQPAYLTLENLLRPLTTQYLVAMTSMLLGLPWHSSQNREARLVVLCLVWFPSPHQQAYLKRRIHYLFQRW